ncbi:MAG TPA: ABC transporter [Cytophagales bacterium]|jgi:predicted unusual protein kinase regulating ubiquinone biosynthesis (AarF/ABC1/UbiB family)|nr:ABC transporter [Cytophagales bacterium]
MHRATKFVATGAKIGTNYLKHYGKKLINASASKEELHHNNANDIYDSLSQLKGSALKVAQMLSMDKNLLPTAYQQQFALAQYSAPPLSYPLVVKTFEQQLKKRPTDLFNSFSPSAINAASMGQVHQAKFNGKKLAVKIQYPGVADTIKSDLAMVKPIALRMFKINPTDYNEFIQEVQQRLLEEADYTLELKRSMELSQQCTKIDNIVFPKYYPEWSSAKVLTMDWIDGEPLGEYLKNNKGTSGENQRIGQAMWDFYHYQIHQLRELHADPHPGNFIITPDRKLGVIDFGCVKVIPSKFYNSYFKLLNQKILTDKALQQKVFEELRFIYPDDSEKEKKFFKDVFLRLVELLGKPFQKNSFDFSDKKYFEELFRFGAEISVMKEFRESKKARGVKDALYINRTYYGLYNILHELKADIDTSRFSSQV